MAEGVAFSICALLSVAGNSRSLSKVPVVVGRKRQKLRCSVLLQERLRQKLWQSIGWLLIFKKTRA
jgi:hypothetical protein